jgi:hypothetical protein
MRSRSQQSHLREKPRETIMKTLVISILLVSIASPALAGWRKLGNGAAGEIIYYNTQYTRTNNIVNYSYRMVMPYPENGVKSTRLEMQGDCWLRQAKPVSITMYDPNGRKIETYHHNQPMQAVLSGTREDTMLLSMCQ